MKARIKVGFSAKIQAQSYSPVEESDSLELEIDYETKEDLETKISEWQDFIQDKVVEATFSGANKLLQAKKELEEN